MIKLWTISSRIHAPEEESFGVYNAEVAPFSPINIVFTQCRGTLESFGAQSQPARQRERETRETERVRVITQLLRGEEGGEGLIVFPHTIRASLYRVYRAVGLYFSILITVK